MAIHLYPRILLPHTIQIRQKRFYSAEEQRALTLITLEEKQQKEATLLNDFRTMLKEKQQKMIQK